MIAVTPAVRWESEYIGSHLRAEDHAEVVAATGGLLPKEVVPQSFDLSTQCYTIRHASASQVDDRPASIFGVCDDPEAAGLGLVWLLATDDVLRVSRSVLQAAPHFLNAMSREYPLGLHNYVDHRNLLHLKWCLKSGFIVLREVDLNGFRFHHIHRPRPQEYQQCATLLRL